MQDEGRIADHWTAHGDPATRDQRNGGAHWAYLSRLLNNNSASGEGPVVGASKTIADTTLFEVSHIYLQLYPEEMRAAVCPLTRACKKPWRARGVRTHTVP